MVFRFNPEADAELTEARDWYSHQRKDLDVEFTQCIDDALSRIANTLTCSPEFTETCGVPLFTDSRSLLSIRSLPTSFR